MISKRYLSLVNTVLAAVLLLAGLSLAYEFYRGRELPGQIPATGPRPAAKASPTPVSSEDRYAAIVSRNLWREKFDAPEPERIPTPPPPPLPPPKLKLIGTVISPDPSRSRAIIEDQVNRSQRIYQVGDVVAGVKIMEISRNRVVLDNQGQPFELINFEGSIPVPEVILPLSRILRKIGENRWLVSRSGLWRMIKEDIMGALAKVGCRPYYPPGRPPRGPSEGYEVVILPKDHIAARLGVKQGDIILSVNDELITGKKRALELLKEVQDEEVVVVKVRRGSEAVVLEYEIQEEYLSSESPPPTPATE